MGRIVLYRLCYHYAYEGIDHIEIQIRETSIFDDINAVGLVLDRCKQCSEISGVKIDLKNCDIFSTKIFVDNAPLNDAKTFLLFISLCPFSFICQNGDGCVTIHKSWFHLCREGHTPFLRLDLFYHLKNDCRKKTPWNPFGQPWIRPYIPGTTSPYLPNGSILSFDMPR